MGVRTFLSRADQAVQDAKTSVSTTAVLAGAALIIAALALVIAVRRTQ